MWFLWVTIVLLYLLPSYHLTIFPIYSSSKTKSTSKLHSCGTQVSVPLSPIDKHMLTRSWLHLYPVGDVSARGHSSLMVELSRTLCNTIQRLHLRCGCCWRRFAPRWRGSSLPRVPSTHPSRGVSHSAVTELRRIGAAGVRWAWRGSSHPETTDYFTGTKLC